MDGFKINEDGTITRDIVPARDSDTDKLMTEYSQLEYKVLNNHRNPSRDPADLARYAELQKILGIDEKKSADALSAGRNKVRAKLGTRNTSIFNFSDKQKD